MAQNVIIPSVIETSARGERAFDIYSLLLRERIIFLGTPIDDQIANLIIAQLLYLDREDPENDIIRGILVKHTGQDDDRIRKDFDRDFYMNPEQAKAYGMVDEILSPRGTPT